MVRKELPHFMIGDSYGGNQDWFRSFMMRVGGCGAETACDSSLYFALHKGLGRLYPFDKDDIKRDDYVEFAQFMEKYLWPRMSGIDRPEIFVDGYAKYLEDAGEDRLSMDIFSGAEPYEAAAETIKNQIDAGMPVPSLTLNHADKEYRDYNWHWYLINGYEENDGEMLIKAVTYSGWQWLDLRRLWDTGHIRRGGLILFSM